MWIFIYLYSMANPVYVLSNLYDRVKSFAFPATLTITSTSIEISSPKQIDSGYYTRTQFRFYTNPLPEFHPYVLNRPMQKIVTILQPYIDVSV